MVIYSLFCSYFSIYLILHFANRGCLLRFSLSSPPPSFSSWPLPQPTFASGQKLTKDWNWFWWIVRGCLRACSPWYQRILSVWTHDPAILTNYYIVDIDIVFWWRPTFFWKSDCLLSVEDVVDWLSSRLSSLLYLKLPPIKEPSGGIMIKSPVLSRDSFPVAHHFNIYSGHFLSFSTT